MVKSSRNTGAKTKRKTRIKTTTSEPAKKSLPEWVIKPFSDASAQLKECLVVSQLMRHGIAGLQGIPALTKALKNLADGNPNDYPNLRLDESDIKRDEEMAEQAKEQLEKGVPLLAGMVVTSFWSTIEIAMNEFLVQWLLNERSARKKNGVLSLKIPVFALEGLDEADKCLYIIDELELKTGAIHKKGVGRFEALFEVFDLSGPVDDPTKRAVLELQQVRHVYAHRRGIVDKKLLQFCPWLKIQIGKPALASVDQMMRYGLAGPHYFEVIKARVREYLGLPPSSSTWKKDYPLE